ncbi:MAG: hypothetical protein PPP56_05690 [Longimonas sp.]|uniref:hypothetical protein n=1 Tax=Longimonas sp. TaxID=2039626 RepID=UPI00335EBFB2
MESVPGFLVDAHVRDERADDLDALIRSLFARRHLRTAGSGQQQMWMVAEFIQQMRARSAVFKALSTKMDGPIPFGIGHCTIKDGAVEQVARPLPLEHPNVFARVLSEFVAPGAVCGVEPENEAPYGWRIDGVDELTALDEHALRSYRASA